MYIGPALTSINNVVASRPLTRASRVPTTSVAEQAESKERLSVDFQPGTLQLPNFANSVSAKQRPLTNRDSLSTVSDAWVEKNLHSAHLEEKNLWLGVGRFLAYQDAKDAYFDWNAQEHGLHTGDLWHDEEGAVAALTDLQCGTDKAGEKVAGLLRMIDAYAGPGLVTPVLREYLAASGGLVDFEGLYNQFQSHADPARSLPAWSEIRGWIDQVGHPVLQTEVVKRNGSTSMSVRQQTFSLYPDKPIGQADAQWTIPLRIKFKDSEGIKEVATVLRPEDSNIDLPAVGEVSWAYPNGGGSGWFRTELPENERQAARVGEDGRLGATPLSFHPLQLLSASTGPSESEPLRNWPHKEPAT